MSNTPTTHPVATTVSALRSAATDVDLRVGAALGLAHPTLGAAYARGRTDREDGEITVATVLWVSMTVLIAGAIGLILWNKIRAKANSIDLDAPTAGVGQ